MSRVVIKRGNDQVVTLVGLRTTDPVTVYLNSAEVKATLFDSKGTVVQPFQEVSMPYVQGSEGNYEWSIAAANSMLSMGVEYSLEIKAVQDALNYRAVHAVSVVDA